MNKLLLLAVVGAAIYTWAYESWELGLVTAALAFLLGWDIGANREKNKWRELAYIRRW